MLRVKTSLPEGTIAALSVIFWKRLLVQRIGENELENPELEELDQHSRYKVKSIFA